MSIACSTTSIGIYSLIRCRVTQSVIWYIHLNCKYKPFVVITRCLITLTFVYACSPVRISTSGSRGKALPLLKFLYPNLLNYIFNDTLTAYSSTLPPVESNSYTFVSSIGLLCYFPVGLPKASRFLSFTQARIGIESLPGTTTLAPI